MPVFFSYLVIFGSESARPRNRMARKSFGPSNGALIAFGSAALTAGRAAGVVDSIHSFISPPIASFSHRDERPIVGRVLLVGRLKRLY